MSFYSHLHYVALNSLFLPTVFEMYNLVCTIKVIKVFMF